MIVVASLWRCLITSRAFAFWDVLCGNNAVDTGWMASSFRRPLKEEKGENDTTTTTAAAAAAAAAANHP